MPFGVNVVVLDGVGGWSRLGLHGLDVGSGFGLGRRGQVVLWLGVVDGHGDFLGFDLEACAGVDRWLPKAVLCLGVVYWPGGLVGGIYVAWNHSIYKDGKKSLAK